MLGAIFPGQGVQSVGMGKDFIDNFKIAKTTLEEADDILQYRLSKLIQEGPSNELNITNHAQPAIFTVSVAIAKVAAQECGLKDFELLAGHSLGEYTALWASNSLDFATCIKLLSIRGSAMANAIVPGISSMVAVLGLEKIVINNILNKSKTRGDTCVVANHNSPDQVVISGHQSALLRFMEVAKEYNPKRMIPLNVSAAFHSPLMQPAADQLELVLESIDFNEENLNKVISNVTARPYQKDPKLLLSKQITSQVRWQDCMEYMIDSGIKQFIEIGPGKVLQGLLKRIEPNISIISINSVASLADVKIS